MFDMCVWKPATTWRQESGGEESSRVEVAEEVRGSRHWQVGQAEEVMDAPTSTHDLIARARKREIPAEEANQWVEFLLAEWHSPDEVGFILDGDLATAYRMSEARRLTRA